ncbi:DgyrCDS10988 [Dimorphilus gyrociliatus]|uniref:Nucleoside diphosphate-linked moiety X motif 6 n=1 Tax=Dimorphilus gyrociliatus TaxID=2664684 RepID=A0A7I8W1Y6_9ANNE|nr:DgyrCDS10988 [Dimorphilus gyrociliatus]
MSRFTTFSQLCKFAKRQYCSDSQNHLINECFKQGRIDKYKAVTVNLSPLPEDTSRNSFKKILSRYVEDYSRAGIIACWMSLPISKSFLIPPAAELGFEFHHAEKNNATLIKTLSTSSSIPLFASHQVGVAGCVVNDESKEILFVKDKHRPETHSFSRWKLPGGLADLGEDIADAAVREVYEETNIQAKFQGILSFRQHHSFPGAWGRSDLYFICHLKPITTDIQHCTREIQDCKWITLEEIKNDQHISPVTRAVIAMVDEGLSTNWRKVNWESKVMPSVYPGQTYTLFSSVC